MSEKRVAVRNLRLCTKECLCLNVCPTGATDTENSIIDVSKCNGCGICADACNSGAISMIPLTFPPQQKHEDRVVDALNMMIRSKSEQESVSLALDGKFARALTLSTRRMTEDLFREAGYMLPQSRITHAMIEKEISKNQPGFPVEAAKELLKRFEIND